MTDQPAAAQSKMDDRPKKHTPWRWAWMGFALAVILWFGSSSYFQQKHQFAKIEYQAGTMEEADYEALTVANMRYSLACKLGAGVLCLASLMFLLSQADVHRPHRSGPRG